LNVKVKDQRLQVPVNSLLFRSEGLRAVVVDANNRAHLQPLTIGRDYGVTLEVLNGLNANDWIVVNPADSLIDGEEVHVKQIANPMAPPSATPNAPAKPANGGVPTGKKPG
jgi:hypothetical protein